MTESSTRLRLLGERLAGKRIVNVNSTRVGGGVAEILTRMVPLLRELGLDARWEVMRGTEDFFVLTKNLHNALHGRPASFGARDAGTYDEVCTENLKSLDLDVDLAFIHDPQPAGLVRSRDSHSAKWIWRCHIDVSAPAPGAWEFIAPMVERYDLSVFSAPQFARSLDMPQALISPSIDPLSDKNRELGETEIQSILARLGIHSDKPIVTQVSRFDRLKDPVGVLHAWQSARKRVDSQLILAGGSASDDPEGAQVLKEVREQAGDDPDVHISGPSANGKPGNKRYPARFTSRGAEVHQRRLRADGLRGLMEEETGNCRRGRWDSASDHPQVLGSADAYHRRDGLLDQAIAFDAGLRATIGRKRTPPCVQQLPADSPRAGLSRLLSSSWRMERRTSCDCEATMLVTSRARPSVPAACPSPG